MILFISKICSQLHLSLFYRYLALRQTIRVNIEKDMALQLLLEQLGNIAMNICSQKIVTDQRGDRVCLASLPVRRCCINSGEVSVQQQSRGVVTGCRPHFLSHRSRTMSQWFTQFSRMDLRPSRFDPSEPRWLELQDSLGLCGQALNVERLARQLRFMGRNICSLAAR